MEKLSKSCRPTRAIKFRANKLAAVLCIFALTLTGCAPTKFYPISGRQQSPFEHAKTLCQAAIAGHRPAYVVPKSVDDLSTDIDNFASAIRWRREQQHLFNACMLRHGWHTSP